MASDNRKVGDIVDYYLDLSATPHLAYVAIMTGGFLDMGGDTRAVPASAITTMGDSCKINITSSQFWDVPVLPENRQRFLSDPQHRKQIAQLFSQEGRTASSGTSTSSGQSASQASASGQSASQSSAPSSTTASTSTDDPNRAGAMTGRASGQSQLISYSELRNADAYGQEGERLGFFVDAWINLNDNRIPYVEITPTFQPFRTNFDRRYAIPTAKLGQKREYSGYNVQVTSEELSNAESVTETQGVKMLEEGQIGNAVLRVAVPER